MNQTIPRPGVVRSRVRYVGLVANYLCALSVVLVGCWTCLRVTNLPVCDTGIRGSTDSIPDQPTGPRNDGTLQSRCATREMHVRARSPHYPLMLDRWFRELAAGR